jgi:hypothetical protein
VFVAHRDGPEDPWTTTARPVSPVGAARFDDKPSLAVDPRRDRVYVAWSRIRRDGVYEILLSRSSDGARTWSRPVRVNDGGLRETYVNMAVARSGDVYVVWDSASEQSIRIDRSRDGGRTWGRDRTVVDYRSFFFAHCGAGTVIAAQGRTCVRATPIVTTDDRRVYVTYADAEAINNTQAVYVSVFSPALRPLLGAAAGREQRVVPSDRRRRSDQFWPASALDPSSGRLWVCYYDTRPDPLRRRTRYTCTTSADGGRTWTGPVRAARTPSDETQPGFDARQYGDYEGLAVANGVAHPIWTDSRDLRRFQEEIYTTTLRLNR